MDCSSDKEATIAASDMSSSEYVGTLNQMLYYCNRGVNELGPLTKNINIQAIKKIQILLLCLMTS